MTALAIDACSARIGGQLTRVRELTLGLSILAPEHRYVMALKRTAERQLVASPPRLTVLRVPERIEATAPRLAWEHLRLPRLFAAHRPEWVLGLFNVLPLGPPRRGGGSKRALLVNNIGPFVHEHAERHGRYRSARLTVLRQIAQRSLASADHVFLLSREAERLLGSRLDGKRVTFMPIAPPHPRILADADAVELPDELRAGRFLLMVGDVMRHKGMEDAVRAMSEVSREAPEVKLAICGAFEEADYLRWLRQLAREGPAERSILFLGNRDPVEALALMKASAATIVCSRIENGSRVPTEAMAVGAPLVAADLVAQREPCGDAAAYYPAGDSAALARTALEIITSPAARADLLARQRARLDGRDWLGGTRTMLEALELL